MLGGKDTVFVSAASGAIGLLQPMLKKIGRNNNISSELKKACPEGIDLYFDNVGGKHLASFTRLENLQSQ